MATTSAGSAGPSQTAPVTTPQWRQFPFFDLEEVKDQSDQDQIPQSMRDLKQPFIVAPTSTFSPLPSSLIISSSNDITIVDRHFAVTKQFHAWEGNGRCTALIEAGGLLVGIGDGEAGGHPVLKIWDLTKEEKKKAGGGPVLMRNVKIQYGQRPQAVTCIAMTSNLSHLAIGLGQGTVLLYRHLLQSLHTSPTSLASLPKARVVHESAEPITGLGFREIASAGIARGSEADKPGSASLSLFMVTTSRILSVSVSGRGGDARTIDDIGCGLGCATMDWDRREMVVARDEAVYLYGPEGRGACYAYEGVKSRISVFRHNLVITSAHFVPSASSNSATVRHYVSKNGVSDSSDIAKVTIFDLQNKLIAYSGTFREGVREVFHQWKDIYVLGSNNKLSRLDEHSTSAKLDVLYRRNLYTLAISLAKSQGTGDAGVADIHRRYGDYLYTKGDFDGSMSQFVKTLGYLQPSYVIRKFLNSQRIHNLTTYLQELHSRNLANPDHTTLLLNCYTKTGDRSRLDTFIKAEVGRSGSGTGNVDELPFDLDTAIRVCRQAGFYEHAGWLAKRWGRHEDYLRIQIEDAEEYGDALRYVRSLGHEACEENLVLYGRMLLLNEPDATTELLIDLCSGQLGRKPVVIPTSDVADGKTNGIGGPAVLSYLGVNRVTGLFTGDTTSSPTTATAAETAQVNDGVSEKVQDGVKDAMLDGVDPSPTYDPPSSRLFFAHFVDHHDRFVRFLEAVAEQLWGQAISDKSTQQKLTLSPREDVQDGENQELSDQRAVWNTLLELYLASTKSSDSTVATAARRKALALLDDRNKPYDPVHAMILCSTAGFTDGLVKLWEAMGMYEDILRFWMEKDKVVTSTSGAGAVNGKGEERHPSDEVIRYLDLYGPTNHDLYPLVLRYLTSSPQILSRHSSRLPGLLATIDDNRILPPLAVVQLLSRNGVASVGQVKDWLRQKVQESRSDVESDKHLVESYRSETREREKDLKNLADPSQPEVFQVTRCAACQTQLDLPAVHFMCKHSYHQRCLSDSEPECILCARQHSIIREVRRGQTRLADRHDLFLNEVHEADDGFAVVAGAFGRGLMDKRVDNEV